MTFEERECRAIMIHGCMQLYFRELRQEIPILAEYGDKDEIDELLMLACSKATWAAVSALDTQFKSWRDFAYRYDRSCDDLPENWKKIEEQRKRDL